MLYNGHMCVNQSKKSQVPKVIITHWKNDECEYIGENIMISLYGLLPYWQLDYIMRYLNLDVMCI